MKTTYKLVHSDFANELEAIVNEHLKQGWELYGNFGYKPSTAKEACLWTQALIKEEGHSAEELEEMALGKRSI